MLKKVGLGLVAFVVLLIVVAFVGGAMIDPHVELETSATLKAPPAAVYALIGSPEGVKGWWLGSDKDIGMPEDSPPMTVDVTAEQAGPGGEVVFGVDGTTAETWTLVEVVPPNKAVWDVDFAGMFTVHRTLTVSDAEGGGTQVKWHETAELDGVLMRWMRVLMAPEDVIANFDNALQLLGRRAAPTP